jgi:DNA polymerase I
MPASSSPPLPPAPPTLYLIDAYAQFFRAYHAIRTPMSSPVTKEPTNMTFGFIGMLLKLLRGEGKVGAGGGKPNYIAVTLDVSDDRGTFRSELYPDYKAHRPPPPEDLEPQVKRCLAILESMRVPTIGAAGFEADDVIATLVTTLRARHPDLRIRIISKDKDLKQLLVNDHVELFDIHTDLVINQAALKEDLGIEPAQVVDFLALMGDNVDNVPGVDGVGPKTAAQLIAEFGSLDGVLAEARKDKPSIKGKRLENIRAADAAGILPLSRTLVTLRRDVPVSLDLADARASELNLRALAPALKELGFNRYQDELKLLTGEPLAPMNTGDTKNSLFSASPPAGEIKVRAREASPAQPTTSNRSTQTSHTPLFSGGLFDQPSNASDQPAAASIRPQSGEYRCITSPKQLKDLVEELRAAEIIALDTETTGLQPMRTDLVGVCLSTKIGTGVYVPVRSPTPADHLTHAQVIDALRPILEDPSKPKCGHNLKFDALVLRKAGIRVAGFFAPPSRDQPPLPECVRAALPRSTVFDSMIASFLIDASRSSHGLDSLALALLNRTNISIKDLIGSGPTQRTFDQVPLDLATQYAAEDADVALQLRAIMLPQLVAMGLMPLFEQVEMPLVDVLAELEWNGIKVDRSELDRQRARLQTRIDELHHKIDDEAMSVISRTFNPESPKQLSGVLFNKPDHASEPGLGLKPIKRTKTGFSTDAEVLETLAEDPEISTPIPKLIVEHRELTKLVGTYLVALSEDIYPPGSLGGGRIHCSFHQTVASTGRLACSDPNLQNIPIRTDVGRDIRRAFVAEPGTVLITADYSQIELRLLAHLSRDPALIQAFHDGQDIHTAVAAQINSVPLDQVTKQQRSGAKMVNFGIVYGITAFGLARRLGISNTAAEEIITSYKKRFAGITTFLQECVDQAQRFGYVETMLKRRRPILDIDSTNPSRRAFAERTAINSVVQGSAADLIKLAMVEIQAEIASLSSTSRERKPAPAQSTSPLLTTHMLLQIHDELVFECPAADAPQAKDHVVSRMENAMQLTVPLKADASIATNWFEGK